jgi:hypothetical protein
MGCPTMPQSWQKSKLLAFDVSSQMMVILEYIHSFQPIPLVSCLPISAGHILYPEM